MNKLNYVSEIKLSYNRVQVNESKLNDSYSIARFIKKYLELIKEDITLQEKFFALYLDVRLDCIGVLKVGEGGIDCVLVDSRLIYSTAVTTGAKSVIIVHNHPTGKVDPSAPDAEITRKTKEGLATLDVKLLDHIIISPLSKDYYSFNDSNRI